MAQYPTPRRTRQRSGARKLFSVLSVLAGIGVCLTMVVIASGMMLLNSLHVSQVPQSSVTVTANGAEVAAGIATPSLTLPAAYAVTAESTAMPTRTSATPTQILPTVSTEVDNTSGCPPPVEWELHHVLPGETLFAYVLGADATITTDDIRTANCLTSDLLQINQPLYLPPGAAENAPSSDPVAAPGTVGIGPRTPDCTPHCTISIRPGWRTEQIAAAIDTISLGFWGSDFMAATGPGASTPAYDFLSTKPAGQSLEGYLYPGTYELSNSTTAAEFRDMLLAAFAQQIPADAAASAAAHGMTLYEALTLASIIQRESWAYEEQVLISSVFHNRLRADGKLGSTVTAQYWYGAPGNWWPRITGSQINTNSPYNTNINPGLPPSPIANPGIDAMRAALTPASTNYLFFTGNCQGPGNVYARTFDEHLANVNACN